MLLLLRIRPPESSLSVIAALFWVTWTVLGCTIAKEEGFWFAEPWDLESCCWWGRDCEALDCENCCSKCSCCWIDDMFCGGTCGDDTCCCCETVCNEWCALGCKDGALICGLCQGGRKGGFPCAPDDSHGWLGDCGVCGVLGVEEEEPTTDTLIRPCPWKFYKKMKNKTREKKKVT